MSYKHIFKASLAWNHPEQPSVVGSKIYTKSHHIAIEGKADLQVSAAKAFKGDPALYNPEDLLLSSLISCHMMSYLYVCYPGNGWRWKWSFYRSYITPRGSHHR